MGLTPKILNLLSLAVMFYFISGFFPYVRPSPDHIKLVYKGCADQKFQDPTGVYSKTLQTLFDTLLSESPKTNFYKTTSGEGESAILGLYQCRGDLTTTDCYECVKKLPKLTEQLCGKSIAARIQLNGCYLRYEVVGFKQVSGTEFLYRVCGSTRASDSQFEEKRETVFEAVEKAVSGAGGFYTASYEAVYVLGQCEGDLLSGDCGDCVKSALERAKLDCGSSLAAQVYLHMCYASYTYYPNGVPSKSSSSISEDAGTDQKQSTQKTVVIVVGGAAAVGFGCVCLMFVRSVMKSHSKY